MTRSWCEWLSKDIMLSMGISQRGPEAPEKIDPWLWAPARVAAG